MPGLSDILGGLLGEGSIARQFLVWGVLNSILNGELSPVLTQVANNANARNPLIPLAPGDLAAMVLRQLTDEGWAEGQAAKSGVSPDDFAKLVQAAGVGPTVTDLLSLRRLGKIDDQILDRGLARAGVSDEWTDYVKELSISPPTPQEALVALLQGQISQDEAQARYIAGGGDPTWFQAAFDSNGSAPTPDELSVMANRGVIPWDGEGPAVTSFHQGFLEGPWRDKWEEPYRKLAVYIPPPVTVTTLVSGGYLDDATALKMFQATGMDQATAAAYLAHAHGEKNTDTKALAKSEITTLYTDQVINAADATAMLGALGYDAADSAFILQIQDLQRERQFLEGAITRIHTLYVGYKLDENDMLQALSKLDVPNAQITNLKQTWDLERQASVKQLTGSEIVAAAYYEVISLPLALTKLQQIGYQPQDAWILLANRIHGPVPGIDMPGENAINTD